jgi:hypothetical protein
MTLGQALAAKVRPIVWCKGCGHQAEPDIAAQFARYGADATVIGPSAQSGGRGSNITEILAGLARSTVWLGAARSASNAASASCITRPHRSASGIRS